MKLSEKIRILRKLKGWSQEELGFNLSKTSSTGISRQAVSDWENGRTEPKLDNIRDLATVLSVSYDILLDETVDLNQKEVMDRVFQEASKERKDKTVRSMLYYFSYCRISWKTYVAIPLSIIGIALFVTFFILFFKGYDYWTIILSFVFEFISIISLTKVFSFLNEIKNKDGTRAGCLTYNHLRIEAFDSIGTTIYAPISNIEYMKIDKHHKNFCGTVLVKVKETKEPFILKNIYSPVTLVNTFYQIIGPDEGLDKVEL